MKATMLLVLLTILASVPIYAQADAGGNKQAVKTADTQDSAGTDADLEKLRAESGVDPTKVKTRLSYFMIVNDPTREDITLRNRIRLQLGVSQWSIGLRPELLTRFSGDKIRTGASDMTFSVSNAFWVKERHALAAGVEFSMPMGSQTFSTPYYSLMPSFTYTLTITPMVMFAIQPNYIFSIVKKSSVSIFPPFIKSEIPDLSLLTIRPFFAFFFKTGIFLLLEPRLMYDITASAFDVIISPIFGLDLGGGHNMYVIVEIPTGASMFQKKGVLYQTTFTKNF